MKTLRNLKRKLFSKKNNQGMGVIEIVLIILVLVGLVLIFRTQVTNIINIVFSKVTSQINSL